jgi:phosphoglycerol transferase MdoB-like AlkP superfamily enzyme
LNAPSRSVYAAGLEAFIGILRFRKGPEDVPASRALLVAVLLGQALISLLVISIPAESRVEHPVLMVALELGVVMLGVLFFLRMARHPERFQQTMTAIFGVQLVIAPLLYAAPWLLVTYQDDPVMQGPAQLFAAVVGVWQLVINARILRSATGFPLLACIFMFIGLQLATLVVLMSIVPTGDAATVVPPA